MDLYGATKDGLRAAPVLTSRGCPYQCIFCYRGPAAGKVFRGRSPEGVVEEIEQLQKRFGIDHVVFVDDIFTLDKGRAGAICELLIDRTPSLSWRCQTRADCLDESLLDKMKRARCVNVSMGVESGNEAILAATGKRITKEQIRRAFRMAREAGVGTAASLIIGLPGDTRETVQETIDFAMELDPESASFYAAMPYPGTDLAKMVVERGGTLPATWESYCIVDSDAVGSEVLEDLRVSSLSGRELRYFLMTAQIEFQARRVDPAHATKAPIRGIGRIVRYAFARRESRAPLLRLLVRLVLDGGAFVWTRFRRSWRRRVSLL